MRTHSETDIAMENYPFLLVYIIKMVDCPSLKIVWYLSDWKLRSEFVREWLSRSNASIVFFGSLCYRLFFSQSRLRDAIDHVLWFQTIPLKKVRGG